MTGRLLRAGAAGLALCVGLATLSACTADEPTTFVDDGVPIGSFQLVSFDSCDEALQGLRGAAKQAVGPYGFNGGYAKGGMEQAAPPAGPQPALGERAAGDASGAGSGSGSSAGSPPNYSGTNTHEAGVDEPDIVKTDGRRIITVTGGVLRVVDAATRRTVGSVSLNSSDRGYYLASDLLLSGDRALVLEQTGYYAYPGGVIVDGGPAAPAVVEGDSAVRKAEPETTAKPTEPPVVGPRFVLVDISGAPRILSTMQMDGALVDARQVASTARVVVKSYPRITFPYDQAANDAKRVQRNQRIIDQAGLKAWLPRIDVTTGGSTRHPEIPCDAISRPDVYSGANLLTVLSFDLGAPDLGDGKPVSIVADGDTVYSNGASLYVSSDQRWRLVNFAAPDRAPKIDARTVIYRFDTTSAADRPRFVAGGSVPGYLINQYAMSEWNGNLRVATTTGETWARGGAAPPSQSGVYVLGTDGRALKERGRVEGLGKGERIFSVRFTGPVGYVVTFRQTDPLYTVDLSDPAKPRVRGELKIPGYSSYLHPVGDRLIGIGQDANEQGGTRGTQISLFDVSDIGKPTRLSVYRLSGAYSEAEFDPHAFLYWPSEGLLVVPLQRPAGMAVPKPAPDTPNSSTGGGSTGVVAPERYIPDIGALILHVSDSKITQVGFIRHPEVAANGGYAPQIRRSLVIDQTLWTLSDFGLQASNLHSLNREAFINLR